MHVDRFTLKSQEALAAAQRLAGARRNPEVAPQHLLIALLEQEGGIVVPVLRRANADPEAVRRRANEALDALPTVSGDATSTPAIGGRVSIEGEAQMKFHSPANSSRPCSINFLSSISFASVSAVMRRASLSWVPHGEEAQLRRLEP